MQPQLNPDGYSVKGCSIIYAPAGQAGEYARLAANMYRGCGHKCVYCYVPLILKMTRAEFDAGAKDRAIYRAQLPKDARKYQQLGITEQVLLCFTTDPYHPFDTTLTRETIEVLLEHGMAFCTLTKGGARALRDLELFRPDRDAFASSLTLLDEAASAKWEAGAATPTDRIATLRRFHEAGIYTWVSLEPVLDPDATLEIIRRTHEFVDLFKVGRINYSGLTKKIDWREFTGKVLDVLAQTDSDHYIKQDLQPYLPEGYRNEKYRPQARQFPATSEERASARASRQR
jgi:DNA repair photolyase